MGISVILNIIGLIANGFLPFVPELKWAELGAGLTQKIIEQLAAEGIQVLDENGNVLTKEELALRVQARFQQAIDTVTRISDRAQTELDRTS